MLTSSSSQSLQYLDESDASSASHASADALKSDKCQESYDTCDTDEVSVKRACQSHTTSVPIPSITSSSLISGIKTSKSFNSTMSDSFALLPNQNPMPFLNTYVLATCQDILGSNCMKTNFLNFTKI